MSNDAPSNDRSSIDSRAHFLLFAEARVVDGEQGSWRFVLTQVGSSNSLSATDVEPVSCHERLELLALVRGLEAIDQPARVTLVTNSRYVTRGLNRGLADWRAQDWTWERFGQLVPVRHHDLWRRVDRALQFHEVDCRLWRFDVHAEDSQSGETAMSDQTRNASSRRNRRRISPLAPAWNGAGEVAELAAG